MDESQQPTPWLQSPIEHVLLGILVLSGGQGYGYDLARRLRPERPLGMVARLEAGMAYHYLKKMERSGWVSQIQEQRGVGRTRIVYGLTSSGHAEFERWMAAPCDPTDALRPDILARLYFARQCRPDRVSALFREQAAVWRRQKVELSRELAELGESVSPCTEEPGLVRAVVAFRLAQTRTALKWLQSLEGTISAEQSMGSNQTFRTPVAAVD